MKIRRIVVAGAMLLTIALAGAQPVAAHCDGLDGPVVKAAREALARQNVALALVWVQREDEPEVRSAFERTLAVRQLGDEARELADMYFFETLVRMHRAGEGAPYTGLKPAGRDLGPAIPLADKALDEGSVDALVELITDATRAGLAERFEHAMMERDYAAEDVEAGRSYVHAYVTFIHYVERAYEAATQPLAGHFAETKHTETHDR